jgi:hypothetical protein
MTWPQVPGISQASINVGDLVRVQARLRIDDRAVLAEAARLLGLGGEEPPPRARAGRSRTAPAGDWPGEPAPAMPPAPGPPDGHEPAGVELPMGPNEPSDWRIVSDIKKPADLPDYFRADPLLPETRRPGESHQESGRSDSGHAIWGRSGDLSVPTLFRPRVARAILFGMLSVDVPEGEVDEISATEIAASGEIMETIPRLAVPTARRGAQVLLDVGRGMQPFLADLVGLVELLRSIFGSRLEVLRFDTSPTLGAGRYGRPWPAYRPPSPGTPVLVVTVLGAQSATSRPLVPAAAWTSFVRALRRASCVPVALVPGPPPVLEPELARILPLVPWDRTTTIAGVRRRRSAGAR